MGVKSLKRSKLYQVNHGKDCISKGDRKSMSKLTDNFDIQMVDEVGVQWKPKISNDKTQERDWQTPTTFHHFLKLPVELQIQILRHTNLVVNNNRSSSRGLNETTTSYMISPIPQDATNQLGHEKKPGYRIEISRCQLEIIDRNGLLVQRWPAVDSKSNQAPKPRDEKPNRSVCKIHRISNCPPLLHVMDREVQGTSHDVSCAGDEALHTDAQWTHTPWPLAASCFWKYNQFTVQIGVPKFNEQVNAIPTIWLRRMNKLIVLLDSNVMCDGRLSRKSDMQQLEQVGHRTAQSSQTCGNTIATNEEMIGDGEVIDLKVKRTFQERIAGEHKGIDGKDEEKSLNTRVFHMKRKSSTWPMVVWWSVAYAKTQIGCIQDIEEEES
jgi:hypothetical protein